MIIASTASLTAVLTLISSILALVIYMTRLILRLFGTINGHLEALRLNTTAVVELSKRVEKIEKPS
jgi:hypothetical protein